MTINAKPVFTSDPAEASLKTLTLRLVEPQELARADELFDREHYLGAAKRSGNGLLQVIEQQGRWVALLDWGPAALKLQDRDQWIGWNGRQRADRRNLLVQNRRFLILSSARMPNLASRCLSMSLRALPEQWRKLYGYAPLLAETFTDIEQFKGTSYSAANWVPIGLTKGFKRHRADYYQAHNRPKKLWVYPLDKNCREILCGIDLPASCQSAVNLHSPERDLPLKKAQVDSLREVLAQVPDPRAGNRHFRISSLLALVVMALLAGRKNLAEIQRYGQFLNHTQRVWLDWPPKKGGKGRKAPSYKALYNLLGQLDPHRFAETLSTWMQAHYGTLPRDLALDGKYVRDQVLTLCLSEHQSGAPVATAVAEPKPRTEDNKSDGELTTSKKLFKETSIYDATVTADALYDNQSIARAVVEKGGDYLIQTKDARRASIKTADRLDSTDTPFLSRPLKKNTGDSKHAG